MHKGYYGKQDKVCSAFAYNMPFFLTAIVTKEHKATMPQCVLNEECLFPDHEVRVGHMCPTCLGYVHVLCGVEDPDCNDMHWNVTCNACAGRDLVPVLLRAEMTAATQATSTDTSKETSKEKMKHTRKKVPPKKKGCRARSGQAEKVGHCAFVSACSDNRETGSTNHEECLFSCR
jgi:hypothetical protein